VFQDAPWPTLLYNVRYLEACDLRTVWLVDHYAWPPKPNSQLLEGWTTLAALASATQRIRLGTSVTNVPLRHPALLAKQAATVDCISGGRLDLGLGAGNFFQTEYAWLDIPHLAPGAAIARFAEAVDDLDRLLREHHLSFDGTYYHLAEAPFAPLPVQQPRPPLMLAANGPKALRVAAKYADTWVSLTSGSALAEVRERNAQLDDACAALGRDPTTLERALFGVTEGEKPFASIDALHEFVGRYREAGIQRFIFIYAIEATSNDLVQADDRTVNRARLDAFAAQEMLGLSAVPDLHQS
jgi:alkanesulfonate monooxygenase SsuD/methylene tetrahydromethanopterin reductase-like flavin-dependent oxidoreductase (luciferase family)